MGKMSKKKKVLLFAIGGILAISMLSNTSKEEPTETKQGEAVATEQTKETKSVLDTCCASVAEALNATYKPKGFELMGHANKETAIYAIYMPYTTDEVKGLYAHDKQALRDLWGDVARKTWSYLSEQGIKDPASTDVTLQVYAADSKECIVYLTKHDTKLKQ